MISRTDLSHVIGEKTLHITDAHALAQAIAGYMLEENRTDDIDSLMRDVMAYRAKHGKIEATVVSAFPLTAGARNEVLAALKSEYPHVKDYVLNERIDETVVGGIRLEMANEELDMTVRSRLNTLKRLTSARNS